MRSRADGDRIRVLTMNVYGPANPDWERRRRLIGGAIHDLDPDVVALQEVPIDSAPEMEALLGKGYHLSHFAQSDDGVAGTLATRWAHRLIADIDLRITERSRQALAWTEAVIVEAATPLGTAVFAHHKPSWPFPFELERERQALVVAQAIEGHIGSDPVHAIVLGDFDATPDSASMQFWRGRRSLDGISVCYQDAWEYTHPGDPGYTFDAANPLVRDGEVATAVTRKIDHILVRSGLHGPTLRAAACSRILHTPRGGIWASDHYGVVADLALPTNPPGFRS